VSTLILTQGPNGDLRITGEQKVVKTTRTGRVTGFSSPLTVTKLLAEAGHTVVVDTRFYAGTVTGYATADELARTLVRQS
jgi:hypothetical protein